MVLSLKCLLCKHRNWAGTSSCILQFGVLVGPLTVGAGAVSYSLAFFWDPFPPPGLSQLAFVYASLM